MNYFEGIRQNGERIYIHLDGAYKIECSNGFIRYKDEKIWLRSNQNLHEYVKRILALRHQPIICSKQYYLDVLSSKNYETKEIIFCLKIEPSKSNFSNNTFFAKVTKEDAKIIYDLKDHIERLENIIKTQKDLHGNMLKEKNDFTEKLKIVMKYYADKNAESEKRASDNADVQIKNQIIEIETLKRAKNSISAKESLSQSELKKYIKVNSELQRQRDDALKRLESLQRWLMEKGLMKKAENGAFFESEFPIEGAKLSLNTKLDGSTGLYERRESGRFGSFPSFDNHDDDYNEKYDPQSGKF